MAGPITTSAATDPNLNAAATFSIIGQTQITGTGTISGDVGMNSTGAGITALTSAMVGGTIYSTDGVAPSASILNPAVQANLLTTNDNITGQASADSIGPVLDGLTLTAGVYDIGAGRLNGGILTLDGPGTFIFRASSDFISSGSIEFVNGARACDVYWQVDSLATINGSSFAGTIIAGTGVHFGDSVTLDGRALALGGDVTLLNTTILGPTCVTVPATLNVIKTVINDDGGTAVASDFTINVSGTNVFPSSFAGSEGGVEVILDAGSYEVTEDVLMGYSVSYSDDCSGTIKAGETKTCTITNDDIAPAVVTYHAPTAPHIALLKVPSPLSLPDGPGPVTYTYTLTNIGTVPVSDIALVGDTCSPITLISGDVNNDATLDLDETWVYTCSTTLTETHTNIVTATGWANGISATDIAKATVIVGDSIVLPLIHVAKVPNPFVLSTGGGTVQYTYKVTNPGTVALSNVRLTDDKCELVTYISGDANLNSRLDVNETWTYTCSTNITNNTVNTVTASGDANGLTARDFAIAAVTVSKVPGLPDTGFSSNRNNIPWNIVLSTGILMILASLYFV